MTYRETTASFRFRLKEAVDAVADGNRARFAEMLGAGDNAKQTAQQWLVRGAIPLKYTKALQALGLSIDYINDGEGELRSVTAAASQPAGLDVEKLALLIEGVEGALRDTKRELDAARKARIVALLYADPGIGSTREAVQAALRVAFLAMG